MRLQTWKPQKLKEKLIGNHKETQNTLKISGLFHFTRLVEKFGKRYFKKTMLQLVENIKIFIKDSIKTE